MADSIFDRIKHSLWIGVQSPCGNTDHHRDGLAFEQLDNTI